MTRTDENMKSFKALEAYRLQYKIKALEALIELNTTNLDVDVSDMRKALNSGEPVMIGVALRHIMAAMLSWAEVDETNYRIDQGRSKSHK